jgi:hypothetical protein
MSNVIELPNQQKEKDMDDKIVDSVHEEQFNPNNIEMIKRGILGGLSMLDKAIETCDVSSDMTTMMFSVQKTLNNLNELVGLVEHDMIGLIKNMEAQAAGQWTTQAHLQTLIDTLKSNAIVTDEELEFTWNKLIPPMMEEMKRQP